LEHLAEGKMNAKQKDVDRIRERVNAIEDIFCEIRDHPKTPLEIRRKADFGQGRVTNLQTILYDVLEQARKP
jgi:hypothetical protein